MEKEELLKKCGLDLEKFENSPRIQRLLSVGFLCCDTRKEFAHKIVEYVYTELNADSTNLDIFVEGEKVGYAFFIHKVAFNYKDLVFVFDIGLKYGALVVKGYEVISAEQFKTYNGFVDIKTLDEEE